MTCIADIISSQHYPATQELAGSLLRSQYQGYAIGDRELKTVWKAAPVVLFCCLVKLEYLAMGLHMIVVPELPIMSWILLDVPIRKDRQTHQVAIITLKYRSFSIYKSYILINLHRLKMHLIQSSLPNIIAWPTLP